MPLRALRALFLVLALLECETASFHIFGKKTNNGVMLVMSTSAHKFGSLTHMAITKDQKAPLEIAWGPNYEIFISKIIDC